VTRLLHGRATPLLLAAPGPSCAQVRDYRQTVLNRKSPSESATASLSLNFSTEVRDPGTGAAKGVYPLRKLGGDIEGLRFYQLITNALAFDHGGHEEHEDKKQKE